MAYWCDECCRRFSGPRCKCGSIDATQIPPLDGWVEVETSEYMSLTDAERIERRRSQKRGQKGALV